MKGEEGSEQKAIAEEQNMMWTQNTRRFVISFIAAELFCRAFCLGLLFQLLASSLRRTSVSEQTSRGKLASDLRPLVASFKLASDLRPLVASSLSCSYRSFVAWPASAYYE